MRWIALLATAALLIAAIWAAFGGSRQELLAPPAAGAATSDSEEQTAMPREDEGDSPAVSTASEAGHGHGFAGVHAAVHPEPRRPHQLTDTVVSEMLPLEDSSAGAVGTADASAETSASSLGGSLGGANGTEVPPEMQGPGGDPIGENEIGPGQAAPPVADNGTVLGPEFDDVSTLSPEFQDVEVEFAGPGSNTATEPLPGPGSDSAQPAGPGPGYDDPRTPPPTEPDGSP